jgi:exodeoxyribonuclease VII large subunit
MQYLDGINQQLSLMGNHYMESQRTRLLNLGERLDALDPRRVLQRGYALIQDENGVLISAIRQVKLSQEVAVRMADGSFDAQVRRISPDKKAG